MRKDANGHEILCPEHGRRCAYGGDEPDRCPWCHCAWSHVVAAVARDPVHGHSCEIPSVWAGYHAASRVERAAAMRHEAAIRADSGPSRTGVSVGATPALRGRRSAG